MGSVSVFLTVDTEPSIGGAFRNPALHPVGNDKRVFGKIGHACYGIPLIMDIAERYGFALTFFVEVFNKYYFGEDAIKEVCEYILNRGHSVQLHLHPNYLNFPLSGKSDNRFSDLIANYPLEKQVELIEEGKEALRKVGAPSPIAFRAGCFGADINTMKALSQCGFLIDSSYNIKYIGGSCLFEDAGINDVVLMEGVYQFPVTNFFETPFPGRNMLKPMDVNGASFLEMRTALSAATSKGPQDITIILHSFSFIMPFDLQYKRVKPRFRVIHWFEQLCEFLAHNAASFRVTTFDALTKDDLGAGASQALHTFPTVPLRTSILRRAEHLLDLFSFR